MNSRNIDSRMWGNEQLVLLHDPVCLWFTGSFLPGQHSDQETMGPGDTRSWVAHRPKSGSWEEARDSPLSEKGLSWDSFDNLSDLKDSIGDLQGLQRSASPNVCWRRQVETWANPCE